MPDVPNPARDAFLHGAAGRVFDGSAADAKLVLVSSDDGICSVVTDRAATGQVTEALEAGFGKAALRFRFVVERDDPAAKDIHHREYLVAKGKLGWRVLAATVNESAGGQAMLTAAPE